jgi:hypothetical protein
MTLTATGPLFDGRALKAVDRLEEDITKDVAERGIIEVRAALDAVLQNPTGAYRGQIQTSKVRKDRYEVTDGGVVYGPWLAGVGSRNATSRFKGYTHWRRATQRLERNAAKIAQPATRRRVREMNQ